MPLQETLGDFKNRNIEAGSFTLTKQWIEKSEILELSATAVSVMTALLWHYNPVKKYVYPHQETISKRVKRSVATVKRALAELKRAGYIVSSRTRNGNLYAFTKKFFELFELSDNQVCTEPPAQNELSMNHEHVIEQKTNNKRAVVVSLKDFSKGVERETQGASSTAVSVSLKTQYDLKIIPDILKKKAESGEIRNLQGYWASLRPQVKQEYWEKDSAEKIELEKKAERKRKEEERKAQELAERKALEEEMKKPLNERWTREGAINLIRNMRHYIKSRREKTGLAYDLAKAFDLDIDTIINSEESK